MQTNQKGLISANRGTAQRQLSRFIMLASEWGYYLPVHCPLPRFPISQVQEQCGAPLLLDALETFFATNAALQNHRKIHAFDRIDVYKYITILSPLKQHVSDTKCFFKLHVTPSISSHNSRKGPSPVVFDSVLFLKDPDTNAMKHGIEGNPSLLARLEGPLTLCENRATSWAN